jgi:hypothetical protein
MGVVFFTFYMVCGVLLIYFVGWLINLVLYIIRGGK